MFPYCSMARLVQNMTGDVWLASMMSADNDRSDSPLTAAPGRSNRSLFSLTI